LKYIVTKILSISTGIWVRIDPQYLQLVVRTAKWGSPSDETLKPEVSCFDKYPAIIAEIGLYFTALEWQCIARSLQSVKFYTGLKTIGLFIVSTEFSTSAKSVF
jgi:hypothetical protein